MPFPIDQKYIIETEQELGVIFPDHFKAKMSKENGGELMTKDDDWQIFPFFDKSDKKRISRTSNHIVLETKQARTWGNFPNNGVAIAFNGSGDFLLFLPIKENKEKLSDEIFTWFHETGKVEKVANSIEALFYPIAKPISKPQVKKQKLNALKTDFGFSIEKIPSPWVLTEKILGKKSVYSFQIGKGTDCIVSLQTTFPTQQFENEKYWKDLWIKETDLSLTIDYLSVERLEIDNYSIIVVKAQNWTSVFYWVKSGFTDKWFLRMKTEAQRHKSDFKELMKLLNSIQTDN